MNKLKKIIFAGSHETVRISDNGCLAATMGLTSTLGIHLIDSTSKKQSLSHSLIAAYPDEEQMEYDPDDFGLLIKRELEWLGKENCSHAIIYANAKPYGESEQGVLFVKQIMTGISSVVKELNNLIEIQEVLVPNASTATFSDISLNALALDVEGQNLQSISDLGPGGISNFSRRNMFNFYIWSIHLFFQERILPEVIYENGEYEFPNILSGSLDVLDAIYTLKTEDNMDAVTEYLLERINNSERYKDLNTEKKAEIIARIVKGLDQANIEESLNLAKEHGKIVI